jgi:hypothetical protein
MQERPAVVGEHQLLTEVKRPVDGRVDHLTRPPPDADQRQQGQAVVVQLGAQPQVGGVGGHRQVDEVGQVDAAGVLRALLRGAQRVVTAAGLAHGALK